MKNDDASVDSSMLQEEWYHSIELSPDKFTKGVDFNNIALTRSLLRGCEVANMNCLDVGAMDFLITLLLLRRKANNVTAYDRLVNVRRADYLKKIFKFDFKYISGVSLSELASIYRKPGSTLFDVIVFSGVLYHMFDPLAGLATIRGLLRNGGILLIETSAIFHNIMCMYFNAGKFYPYTNYWQITVECLDYLLRFIKLEPLDCVYFVQKEIEDTSLSHSKSLKLCRVCIACRAVDHCIPCEKDEWMKQSTRGLFNNDFREFIDWGIVEDGSFSDVDYKIQNKNNIIRQDTGTINIFKTIQNSPCLEINDLNEQVRLRLNAKE